MNMNQRTKMILDYIQLTLITWRLVVSVQEQVPFRI